MPIYKTQIPGGSFILSKIEGVVISDGKSISVGFDTDDLKVIDPSLLNPDGTANTTALVALLVEEVKELRSLLKAKLK